MAPRISIPTNAPLPPKLRLEPTNPTVLKILTRLTRPSLLSLVLDWLDERNASLCAPHLHSPTADQEDDDHDIDPADLYPPEPSLAALRALYTDLQARKGSKRDVLDRILEGDWRHGLTLYQLAMADLQHLYEHPQSQRWTAYHIVPLKTPTSTVDDEAAPLKVDAESLAIPRFHPSTFLQNLQAQVLPDVKAHYTFTRPENMALSMLRIFTLDSPYNTNLATTATSSSTATKRTTSATVDASRTIYIAFPDGGPYVYFSKSHAIGPAPSASETKSSLRALVVEGVPKALSRPRQRVRLQPTALTTRNLHELLWRRGAGRTNTAGGGWGVYTDERRDKVESPLDCVLPSPPLSEDGEGTEEKTEERKRGASPGALREERRLKRARVVSQARFGESARVDDGRGVERVDIVIDDPFRVPRVEVPEEDGEDGEDVSHSQRSREATGRPKPIDVALDRARGPNDGGEEDDDGGTWRPSVKLTFHGSHVFAGMRQLVEAGIIDGEKMPGWLTGEEGVTIGAVRHGRIRGYQGSGL